MNAYQQLVQSDRPAEHDPQRAPWLAKVRIATCRQVAAITEDTGST